MAVSDANVFPGFLTPVLTQLSSPNHRPLFSHGSVEVRRENTPEKISPQPGNELQPSSHESDTEPPGQDLSNGQFLSTSMH